MSINVLLRGAHCRPNFSENLLSIVTISSEGICFLEKYAVYVSTSVKGAYLLILFMVILFNE